MRGRRAGARRRVRAATSRSSGAAATSRPVRPRGAAPLERGRARRCARGSRPGHGEELSHRIARAIGRARERVRIASPVLTAGPGARHARGGRGRARGWTCAAWSTGRSWSRSSTSGATNGRSAWKIPILASVLEHADFQRQAVHAATRPETRPRLHAREGHRRRRHRSSPGSFNLSRSGELQRRERARGRTTPSWPTSWPPSSTRSGSATNAMSAPDGAPADMQPVAHLERDRR